MSTPTSPKTPTPPTLPPGVTKTCHIVKRPDFDGYGFNLHSEKVKPGQFIGKVDADSPAEGAGLKEGDRILEVNGVSIGSETHKQVVARIKAIANEVRLLLIDVDGKAIEMPAKPTVATAAAAAASAVAVAASPLPSPVSNGSGSSCPASYEGTKQELPGASANISSISVTSTKRTSNASSIQSGSTMNASDMDVVDRGMPPVVAAAAPIAAPIVAHNGNKSPIINNNNNSSSNNNNNNNNNSDSNTNKMMNTPPPPSATVANMNNNGSVYSSSSSSTTTTTTTTKTTTTTTNGSVNGNGMTTPTTMPAVGATNGGMNRAGSLNLPLTVAEMRAKLASKKKYDPKNESVDLKKKFEIIQKL
ncbi:probable serine/threonine-protein kinase DDB_G0282963 [Drosophila grimshawi]|uniref:GH21023 n=1 Tax=Drosophila grimshawi TaxID=7222 RepID=B4J566_DROGR|nr:probable serine/threonine-protein kinase DDB_G0282963 [Drosophila grimshawi]EDW00692.1 GH21023 [Drosophila grimshawi]